MPVENVVTTRRSLAFEGLIESRVLYRRLPKSPAGIRHSAPATSATGLTPLDAASSATDGCAAEFSARPRWQPLELNTPTNKSVDGTPRANARRRKSIQAQGRAKRARGNDGAPLHLSNIPDSRSAS